MRPTLNWTKVQLEGVCRNGIAHTMKYLSVIVAAAAMLLAERSCAQDQSDADAKPAAEEVNTGQDPTKPLTRVDLRAQYQNLPPDDNDSMFIFTPRVDKPFVLAPGWTLATRIDVPLILTNAFSADNLDGEYEFGIDDLLAQGLLINAPSRRFAWAVGAQVIFPTAQEDQFGAGKWCVVPTVGARYALPEISKGTFFAMVARYDQSIAGDDDRRDISNLQLGPLLHIALPDSWFVDWNPSTDIRYNFADKNPGDDGR